MNAKQDYNQEADYEFFLECVSELMIEHEGKIVLINQKKIIRYYDSIQDAVKAGVEEFGAGKFIAQEVEKNDPLPVSYSLAY